MPTYITRLVDKLPAVEDATWRDIYNEAGKRMRSKITVEDYSEAKEWSDQQRKWWKGVLLPKLAEHTGDSLAHWENTLKLKVMPDDFKPETTIIDGIGYTGLPSITTLGIKKMSIMTEESVAYLRDESIHGDVFHWVTLPHKPEPELETK